MYRYALASIALLTAGCAATPYQPADPRGYGYQDRQITASVYDIMYVANTATDTQVVEDFAWLRAAEDGAALGYGDMVVTDDRSGIVMVSGRSDTAAPNLSPTMPNARDAGMSMGAGKSGGNESMSTAPDSITINSSSRDGDPARSCVLRVRFYKRGEAPAASTSQDIQALLIKLRTKYGIEAPAGGY